MKKFFPFITRTIFVLSVVSLLNDVGTEMLYPVMPLFLTSIGFSTIAIGVLEGVAQAVSGFGSMYFGRVSDLVQKRKPFVELGYLFTASSKLILAVSKFPAFVFVARSIDRLGKGVRTGARDAILSSETTPENKGKVFGFHSAMDTVGAAIGPAIALLLLVWFPHQYQKIFLIAFVPGLLSVFLTFFIIEKKRNKQTSTSKPTLAGYFSYWKQAPKNYLQVVTGLIFFGLMNSADFFLLLKIKASGFSDLQVIEAYIFYNIVYAFGSYPLGGLGDKIGLKRVLIFGLIIFSIVYGGMAVTNSYLVIIILFFIYGLYAAATDGITKALLSNLVPKTETASAIGFYNGCNAIAALFASIIAGWLWKAYSVEAAFLFSAIGSLLVAGYLAIIPSSKGFSNA
jgi:MFS family permease